MDITSRYLEYMETCFDPHLCRLQANTLLAIVIYVKYWPEDGSKDLAIYPEYSIVILISRCIDENFICFCIIKLFNLVL
jgi:hypothetical protein